MNMVYNRLGKTVQRGEGLGPVLRYARVSYVNVVTCKPDRASDTYSVTFHYADGAYCSTTWADWRVLCQWLTARRSWSVTRLTFHAAMQADILTGEPVGWDAHIKRIQKSGTVVTVHDYQA